MRFVIICPSRSGSSMLRLSLARHPQIACHGEILAAVRPRGLLRVDVGMEEAEALRLHATDPGELVRRALGAVSLRGKTSFGFKIIYRQMAPQQAVIDQLAADRGIGLVHLWRRDLCDRFLSHRKYALAARPAAVAQEIRIDPAELVEDVARQQRARAEVLAMFDGHPVIEVIYEDLIAAGDAAPIARFLGEDGAVPLIRRRFEAPDLPDVTVSNEAELREVYAGL